MGGRLRDGIGRRKQQETKRLRTARLNTRRETQHIPLIKRCRHDGQTPKRLQGEYRTERGRLRGTAQDVPTPRAGPGRRGMGGPVLRTGLLTGREGEPVINTTIMAAGDLVAKTRLDLATGPFVLTFLPVRIVEQCN